MHHSNFNASNCLIVSSKAFLSVSKSFNFLASTSCSSLLTFSLYPASFKILLCFSIPFFVFSSFLVAFAISPSMSTRPLTWRNTAAEEETEKTTQPAGRVSLDERIVREDTPLPERDLMDWIWEVAVSWAVASRVWMKTAIDVLESS